MRHTKGLDFTPINFNIDKTLRIINKEWKQNTIEEEPIMGEKNNDEVPQWALKDYFIPNVSVSSIWRPPIQVNNF